MFGSTGEKMIGNVHCHRSTTDAEFSPEKKRGYGFTSRSSPVRRLSRVMKLPLFAAGEEDVGVLRIRRDVPVLAPADLVERIDPPLASAARHAVGARHAHRAVVLLRAAEVVGHVLVVTT